MRWSSPSLRLAKQTQRGCNNDGSLVITVNFTDSDIKLSPVDCTRRQEHLSLGH